MLKTLSPRLVALACILSASFAAAAVTFDFATVGNPGNPAALTGYGAVGYTYKIERTEVTNQQYAQFLNAKALAADPLHLYNDAMTLTAQGGINRSGPPGSGSYAPKPGFENKPVVYVNLYDAMRFVNWLANGQGAGDTENGAYTLLGGTSVPSNNATLARNPAALFVLPNQTEWYKAAYYQPANAGGDSDGYWAYATRSNIRPTAEAPPGGANSANYASRPGILTDAGAYVVSQSYYGTFDQAGNVAEWTEALDVGSSSGVCRGGSWSSDDVSAITPPLGPER